MEEDPLKDIFRNFKPELPPQEKFMHDLDVRLDAVEIIKNGQQHARRRNFMAMSAACIVGFICGVAFSFMVPWLSECMVSLSKTFDLQDMGLMDFTVCNVTPWIIVALATMAVAWGVFRIALSPWSLLFANRKNKLPDF